LKFLGVDVLWLCPVYKSPNCDNGYDISDYKDIMDEFGTMEDFDELLFEAHKRGLKILMDLVVNHTSDEHIWFVNSRKSKNNKYRDYYIWKKGKDGKEPNNWGSSFSGSAWEYDEATDMYYLHCFAKKQPDLNWENEKVRKEVQDIVKWWLDKGIDGFRMDVINMISKDQRFPDGIVPEGGLYGDMSPYVMNGPRVHEYLKELNEKVLSKYNIMTVGETPCVTPEIAIDYVGEDRNELNMIFSFEHMDIDKDVINLTKKPLDLVELKKIMSKWQKGMSDRGWNSLYWNNHDQPRVVSRFGNDTEYWDKSAKMLATCLHMQQGTPYIYQGEEIGMTNVRFQDIEDYRDIAVINGYNEEVIIKGRSHEQYMQYIYDFSRDNARTPMQWDDSDNGGFTTGKPWIKVNPNYTKINVAKQIGDKDSILNYYRRLIKLRKENEIIIYGDFELILPDDKNIFSYTRKLNDEMLLVICNFTSNNTEFSLPDNINYVDKNLLISNYDVANDDNIENFELMPYESRVYLLKV
jgi:oligo-1,6-glucosidase